MSDVLLRPIIAMQVAVHQLREREDGQTTTEYAILLGFLAIAIIIAIFFLERAARSLLERGEQRLALDRLVAAIGAMPRRRPPRCVAPIPLDRWAWTAALDRYGNRRLAGSTRARGSSPRVESPFRRAYESLWTTRSPAEGRASRSRYGEFGLGSRPRPVEIVASRVLGLRHERVPARGHRPRGPRCPSRGPRRRSRRPRALRASCPFHPTSCSSSLVSGPQLHPHTT